MTMDEQTTIVVQDDEPMGDQSIIKVLMHHRIVENLHTMNGARDFCVEKTNFRKQLELLEGWGFTTITFNDYRMFLSGELHLPKKPVILTFDDAYLDTFEIAFPLLKEFGMTGVVFALGERSISHNIWDTHEGLAAVPLMSDQQLLEMHAAGFDIGSHSLTHQRLTHVSKEQAWEEISRSRMLLEMTLNAPVRSFSYPYGLVNESVKQMVADAGYSLACSVYSGPAAFGADPFELRRIAIPGSLQRMGFGLRMLAPYTRYHWLRWKAKQVLVGQPRLIVSNAHATHQLEAGLANHDQHTSAPNP